MYTELFFVPSSYDDQKEKELIDSSCRAHNMRVVHRKRRSKRDTVKGSRPKASHPSKKSRKSTSLITGRSPVPGLTTESLGVPLPDAFPIGFLSSNAAKAVKFVRFHLVKSWSPTFMLRFHSSSAPMTNFEHGLEVKATHWMWQLWNSDAALFWSVIASVLPLLTRYLPHDQRSEVQALALELKERSFEGLRTSLEDGNESSVPKLLRTTYHVKSLFREACVTGDMEAASSHAEALAGFVSVLRERHWSTEYRRIALWGDALPALLQLRRPAVDFSVTLASVVKEIWSAAKPVLPMSSMYHFDPPFYIENEILNNAFQNLRMSIHIVNEPEITKVDHQEIPGELLFQWLTTKAERSICQLLNLYLDLNDSQLSVAMQSKLSQGERYLHMALALSLLYVYQKAFFDMYQDDGTDINESAMLIQPALGKAMQAAELYCSRSEWLLYQKAVLWIDFVGAWAEMHLGSDCKYSDYVTIRDDKFSSDLLKHATELQLNSWHEVKEVLSEFGWAEFLFEQAEQWYINLVK